MMLHYAPSQIDKPFFVFWYAEINGDSRNDSERERERERALAEAESLVEKELEGAIREIVEVEGGGMENFFCFNLGEKVLLTLVKSSLKKTLGKICRILPIFLEIGSQSTPKIGVLGHQPNKTASSTAQTSWTTKYQCNPVDSVFD
ncbi:hypothetical protein YC2023_080595 [Brassica napus]